MHAHTRAHRVGDRAGSAAPPLRNINNSTTRTRTRTRRSGGGAAHMCRYRFSLARAVMAELMSLMTMLLRGITLLALSMTDTSLAAPL